MRWALVGVCQLLEMCPQMGIMGPQFLPPSLLYPSHDVYDFSLLCASCHEVLPPLIHQRLKTMGPLDHRMQPPKTVSQSIPFLL
jgi:hypothetical protein